MRSHLSIEQRRQKLSELKSRSKCLRCGGMGHWAGDPQCKFPGGTKPKDSGPPKPVAHYAISDSSGDERPGIHLGAGKEKQAVANMALSSATPKMGGLVARMDEDEALKPPGSDTKMPAGSYRGKTYWTLLHRMDYYKNVHEYYHVNDQWIPILKTDMTLRDIPAASSSSVARPTGEPKGAPKKPPNPPLPEKCINGCKEFSMQGSTGYTVRKTCRVCGWHTTDRRDREFEFRYEDCPHERTNNLGSSKTLSRTYCLQCGNFINEEPQEDRKKKKDLATAIMEAPNENLEAIHSLAKKSSQEHMSPAHASFVIDLFGGYVQEMIDRNEAINPVSMHRCLTQAIDNAEAALHDDPNPDYIRQGLRDPEHIGYMASDIQMTSDEVYLHLPEVDMWDNSSRDLFVALDEGCNTTCHSEAWASMAESKLKRYGLDMPWISEQGKSFLGLGANTKTQGQRTIPFALWLKEGGAVPGTMDSHQIVGSQKTPLLLSLYAQASLGLIKNMKKGAVMMESDGNYKELELARCKSTGLLLLNITQGINHVNEPFKCHRPFRSHLASMTAMAASADRPSSRCFDAIFHGKVTQSHL